MSFLRIIRLTPQFPSPAPPPPAPPRPSPPRPARGDSTHTRRFWAMAPPPTTISACRFGASAPKPPPQPPRRRHLFMFGTLEPRRDLFRGHTRGMHLDQWLEGTDGIRHRKEAYEAGFKPTTVRDFATDGRILVIRRSWLATGSADPRLCTAADAGARLACVSAAQWRGWWLPPDAPDQLHLSLGPHRTNNESSMKRHWSHPLSAPGPFELIESVEDSLRHIAECLPHDEALVVWESAIRTEQLSPASLRMLPWRSRAASGLADECTGLADSGLETYFVVRMGRRGVFVAQQVVIAGRRVDGLIGSWLVIQVDGHAHHSSPADRARDAAHDAELALRGYTVLRFTYSQVVYQWPEVERTVMRAIAAEFHLHPRASR